MSIYNWRFQFPEAVILGILEHNRKDSAAINPLDLTDGAFESLDHSLRTDWRI